MDELNKELLFPLFVQHKQSESPFFLFLGRPLSVVQYGRKLPSLSLLKVSQK